MAFLIRWISPDVLHEMKIPDWAILLLHVVLYLVGFFLTRLVIAYMARRATSWGFMLGLIALTFSSVSKIYYWELVIGVTLAIGITASSVSATWSLYKNVDLFDD